MQQLLFLFTRKIKNVNTKSYVESLATTRYKMRDRKMLHTYETSLGFSFFVPLLSYLTSKDKLRVKKK